MASICIDSKTILSAMVLVPWHFNDTPWAMLGSSCSDGSEITVNNLAFISLFFLANSADHFLAIQLAELPKESGSLKAKL